MKCCHNSIECLRGFSLADDKTLKTKVRGSYDYRSDVYTEHTIVKCLNNKPVHLISSYCGPEPLGSSKRWSKYEEEHIDVRQPRIVAEYNPRMGGGGFA